MRCGGGGEGVEFGGGDGVGHCFMGGWGEGEVDVVGVGMEGGGLDWRVGEHGGGLVG